MKFVRPLIPATLVQRYKRFLSDATLDDGTIVTAHCANPGAMLGLKMPGMKIWLEPNDDPKRKLTYSWKLTEMDNGHMVGIDTSLPNKVVGEALRSQSILEFADYTSIRPEMKYGQNSRIDFFLQQDGLQDAYVEVKNSHLLRRGDLAEFPDCVTERGTKHLRELSDMAAAGHRAIMLYLVQRTDCTKFALARDIDPKYAYAFDEARKAGVEMICYGTEITLQGVTLGHPMPIVTTP